ncbi:YesN/AraC family two-component response regulator [Caldalkalibacillus uzonensis]|uniref:YesN/AraC family two-component response regulator n=1 Tax=Caldalkalibacillus uzonensis TaxID=353224 RepID=A0ABU0CUA0_9BACI|nr:helix-turn-helix domain-containing protein [Caldalkalibacillus uzonensis]MDQ0340003.1 YesN/AraC family two-component response regulator [Caldalkalibacillus uzonensis]
MPKLLIADRDATERTGIKWFVASHHLPFTQVDEAADVDQLIQYVETYCPDVVVLELEMIPDAALAQVTHLLKTYVQTVICLTTESVFERALQAIELQAASLLVKPLELGRLQQALRQACVERSTDVSILRQTAVQNDALAHQEALTSTALFIDHALEYSPACLLVQPEKAAYNKELYHWLQTFHFPVQTFVYPLSDMVACVLSFSAEDEHKENEQELLQQEGQRLLQQWWEHHQSRVSIAIHPSYLPAASLHQIYLRTKEALKLQFYKGHQQLFWVDEQPPFITIDPFLTPDEQRTWIQHLEQGSKQEIKRWLYAAFTQFSHGLPEPDLLRIRLTSILAQLRRFMQTYHLDQDPSLDTAYHSVFQSILYAPILFSIVQDMLLFCFDLIDGAARHKQSQTYDVVEKALQVIESRYGEHDLSLQAVAKEVERSPGYLSALLTRRKGKTFRQLLTELRMEKAKRLLAETDLSVRDISEQVGYGDPNYFSRAFKQHLGLSPRAFRFWRCDK